LKADSAWRIANGDLPTCDNPDDNGTDTRGRRTNVHAGDVKLGKSASSHLVMIAAKNRTG
jgi:hypothetical protein